MVTKLSKYTEIIPFRSRYAISRNWHAQAWNI